MDDKLNSRLTDADVAEFEGALTELTGTERHIFFRLMEIYPLEEVFEIIAGMEDVSDRIEQPLTAFDPYARCMPISLRRRNQNIQMGTDGQICVKNPSACWVPELMLHRQIGGTVYIVTGSYSGSEPLDKKLIRVMMQNAEKSEESE